jgi:predicted kinase
MTHQTRYQRLFVLRGLPGSGKSTVAREMVANMTTYDKGKATNIQLVAVSRDDFRKMFNGRRLGLPRQEQLVTIAQDATILGVLEAGCDVIVHNTSLRDSDIRHFARLAAQAGAEMHVVDLRGLVSLEECIRRDALRTGDASLGEDVIRKMHADHIAKPGTATMALAATASAVAAR